METTDTNPVRVHISLMFSVTKVMLFKAQAFSNSLFSLSVPSRRSSIFFWTVLLLGRETRYFGDSLSARFTLHPLPDVFPLNSDTKRNNSIKKGQFLNNTKRTIVHFDFSNRLYIWRKGLKTQGNLEIVIPWMVSQVCQVIFV